MAALENTVIPGLVMPTLQNVDPTDPVLAFLPDFHEPVTVSQRPYSNFGPLKMRVEAHNRAGARVWVFEYDLLTCGDPS